MSGQLTRDGWFSGSTVHCQPEGPPRDRTFRLILLGPPGVGKGTQAELLCRRLRTCQLSTGDLFRAAKCEQNPSPAMSAALEVMRRGELVSDELVMSLVRERLQCLQCHGGFLLDGVPRTLQQAKSLEHLLQEAGVGIDAVLHYELPLAEIVDRIGGRLTCSQCKTVYHVTARPPANAGKCDQCDGSLMQRDDDRPEAVRVRMQAYREATQPLTDFYAERNALISIAAHGAPDAILQQTMQRLGEHLSIAVGQR